MEKNKTPKTQAEVNKYLLDNPVKNPANLLDIEQVLQNDGLKLPEDVRVNSSGIGCIAFTKWYEKSQYPKTYKECAKELGYNQVMPTDHVLGYKGTLLSCFQQLIICRDAYWKIAGEQMGLDKPWNPQFENCNTPHYCIFIKHTGEIYKDCFYVNRCLLAFPTSELRDAFYENFKDLIESCKELL